MMVFDYFVAIQIIRDVGVSCENVWSLQTLPKAFPIYGDAAERPSINCAAEVGTRTHALSNAETDTDPNRPQVITQIRTHLLHLCVFTFECCWRFRSR